jgi:hypothetical protein
MRKGWPPGLVCIAHGDEVAQLMMYSRRPYCYAPLQLARGLADGVLTPSGAWEKTPHCWHSIHV